jgi:uncharacterized pyridoxamine 5'-phosphate oxidase family protein
MNKQQILDFVSKNPMFGLATAEDNKPHVRNMMLYRADENGIIFSTGEDKDVRRQLQKNPQVEMCFFSGDANVQVRIDGTVEVLEDLELKKQIVEDYPFLKEWIDREGYEVLIVYCLKSGRATTWTMATSFKPKEYVQL